MFYFAHEGHIHHAEQAGPSFLTLFIIIGIAVAVISIGLLVAQARAKAPLDDNE